MLYADLMKPGDLKIAKTFREVGCSRAQEIHSKELVYLGHGVNARAYKLPSGNIIRVEREVNEDGWHSWMEKVVVKDKTSMTAKVGMYETFEDRDSGDTACISIQERLYTINTSLKAFQGMSEIGNAVANIITDDDPMYRWRKECEVAKNLHRFFPQNEVEPFAELVRSSHLDLNDTHMGNIMFRKHGERVILTDPVN